MGVSQVMKENGKVTMKKKASGGGQAGGGRDDDVFDLHLARLVNNPPELPWFTMRDLMQRYALSIALHYYLLITRPMSYTLYTWRWSTMCYYTIPGAILTLFIPVLPLMLILVVIWEQIMAKFKANWKTASPGATFFSKPGITRTQGWVWDLWLNISIYTSNYMIFGHDAMGVRNSFDEKGIETKHLWFRLFQDCGARYPRHMVHWDGNDLKILVPESEMEEGDKIMVKLYDSYLGIGDAVFEKINLLKGEALPVHPKNKERDVVLYFRDYAELKALMSARDEYMGVAAYGSEFVLPHKDIGIHQSDHLTMALPNGKVKVLRSLFWGDCTGETSHSSTSGYFIDSQKETIEAPTRWYSPVFRDAPAKRSGQHIPGTKAACEKACEMHAKIVAEHPWCRIIGWDTMTTTGQDKSQVFFEGNMAMSRFRRHIFSGSAILIEACRLLAPFTLFGITIFGSQDA